MNKTNKPNLDYISAHNYGYMVYTNDDRAKWFKELALAVTYRDENKRDTDAFKYKYSQRKILALWEGLSTNTKRNLGLTKTQGKITSIRFKKMVDGKWIIVQFSIRKNGFMGALKLAQEERDKLAKEELMNLG